MIPTSKKKRRVVMMEPIIGNMGNRNKSTLDIKRPLTSKQDIPHLFLNQLMHPKNYLNA